jgi:hypothetical protein
LKIIFSILLLTSITGKCFSQNDVLKTSYPFNLQALEKLSYDLLQNENIAPVYLAGGFTYVNTRTKLPAIKRKFEEAYPFYGNFGLVKVDGKYGIINRNGNFLVKPTFPQFRLIWDVNYGISFDINKYFSFRQGKLIKEPEIVCVEPVSPQLKYYQEEKRFGLMFRADTINKAIFDSVYTVLDRIAIVNKSGNIGVVDYTGKILLSLDYEKYTPVAIYCTTNICRKKKRHLALL